MTLISQINNLEKKKHIFLLILFALSMLFRFPTLFNDFYDVDELSAIVQTHEYMAGDIPGKDFSESKLPIYHAIFKTAYKIYPEKGWAIVHVFTIFIIFFTAFYIYLTGKKIFDFRIGAIASILYAVLISSFNRHFMASNGEIVYNLPLTAGFNFFVLSLSSKSWNKYLLLFISICAGIAAAYVKLHGLIFFIFLAVFYLLYYPYYTEKFTKKYFLILIIIFIAFIIILTADYYIKGLFAPALLSSITGKFVYASVKGFNPFIFLVKFLHRQGMLFLWHFILWIPAYVYFISFIKKKCRAVSIEESSIFVFFILIYLMVFAGGSRLYFHYFIAVYPMLCLISSAGIVKLSTGKLRRIYNKFTILLLIPSLFFLTWNIKDIIIKQMYPGAFYNEGRFLYWTRAVLTGSFNDYLLPDPSYKDACEYIKIITKPGDRIFVWGDGPYLYYFSGRRMGTLHLWPKTGIFRIKNLYEKGDSESVKTAQEMEMRFIDTLKKKKPVLFIDTSENGLSTFYFKPTPLVERYVDDNYHFVKEINKIKIYMLNRSSDF